MAFKEYGNYDGVGLADLVRKKQVSAGELLDEAIARLGDEIATRLAAQEEEITLLDTIPGVSRLMASPAA